MPKSLLAVTATSLLLLFLEGCVSTMSRSTISPDEAAALAPTAAAQEQLSVVFPTVRHPGRIVTTALAAFLWLCSPVPELVPGTAAPSDGRGA